MSQKIVSTVSTSYVQDQKHLSKSEKFIPVQPSQIGTVLAGHGFDLVSLKTGRAKLADRADHQTTVARYRKSEPITVGNETFFLEIIAKIPHLYGAAIFSLGLGRLVCKNGLVVGRSYQSYRVRHVGDCLSQIDAIIPQLVAQNEALQDQIGLMMARTVTAQEAADLARQVATLRLGTADSIQDIQYADLLKVRRNEDAAPNLFNVLNVIQENVMRYGIRYNSVTTDQQGLRNVRRMTGRPVMRTAQGETESVRSVDLNGSIWDAAAALLQNKAA